MAALELRVLGTIEIIRDGVSLELPASKKTRALLGYLLVSEHPQTRSRLCELLFDGPDDPRAALRWSLSKLRPLIDSEDGRRLIAGRDQVELDLTSALVDLHHVRQLLPAGAASALTQSLESAAAFFRGELFEGLELPECYRFHQWLVSQRESTRQLHLSVLEALTLRSESESALMYARRRVSIDPFNEEAHIRIITMLNERGRVHDAIQQYDECRRLFENELSARPSPALEKARLQIGHAVRPATRTASDLSIPADRDQRAADIDGRTKELTEIERFIARGLTGEKKNVLLFQGEPGIGKSRLLEELGRRVRRRGGRSLAGRAFGVEMIRPYGIWIEMFRGIDLTGTDETIQSALSPLFPERPLSEPDGADRNRMFSAVEQFLRQLSTNGLLLVVDDLQWIDEASAALLHYVVRAVDSAPIVIACAARTGELEENVHATSLLRDLNRNRMLQRIVLDPLGHAAISAIARRTCAGVDSDRIFLESGGNPLFAIELSRAAATGEERASESLEGLIDERLASLEPAARELVPWAAALGRHFDATMLGRATGLASGRMIAALDNLERMGIIRSLEGEARYDFAHDLIRQSAYRRLSGPRRLLVHRHIARALGQIFDPDAAYSGEIVLHASLGGDDELGASASVLAGQRCLRMFASAEAAAVAERGLQMVQTLPEDKRLPIEAGLLKVLVISGASWRKRDQLVENITELLSKAKRNGSADVQAAALFLLAVVQNEQGDPAAAERAVLEMAKIARTVDAVTAATSLANTGRCLMQLQRDLPRAATLIREAEEMAQEGGFEISEIPLGRGMILAHTGAADEARAMFERALIIARRENDHWRECISLSRMVMIELEREQHRSAVALCDELDPVAARMAEGSEPAVASMLRAMAGYAESGSAEQLEGPLQALRDIDSKGDLAWALARAAEIDLRSGRIEIARVRAEEGLRAAETVSRQHEAAIARSILSRIAISAGSKPYAQQILAPVLNQRAIDALSERARTAVLSAAEALQSRRGSPRSGGASVIRNH